MLRYSPFARLLRGLALLALGSMPVQGCADILAVTDPDIVITPPTSASGALALHNGVILRLTLAVSGTQGGGNTGEALFMFGGLLTDEWGSGDTFIQRNTQDQRIFDPTNTFNHGPFRNLNRVRVEARVAVDALRRFSPTPTVNIARMFALIAYGDVLLGEHYCNGIPLSEPSGSEIVYGNPLSNDSVFALAIVNADSAIAGTTGSGAGADSLRVRWLASVVKGRALVDRGLFAAAAAAVAGVPDTFHFDVSHSIVTNDNQIWALNNNSRRYTVGELADSGRNHLPFFEANDPRLPRALGTIVPDDRIFDTGFPLFVIRQGIWGRTSPIKVVTGIEARLIEAEAQLQPGGDPAVWHNIINTLRTNTALYPVAQPGFTSGPDLMAVADPGTVDQRVDLMFYERAFWMYSTGHRLGDMRRLVRQYKRAPESVFPTGGWFKGGSYSDAVNMPVPVQEQNNPRFTQCLDREP